MFPGGVQPGTGSPSKPPSGSQTTGSPSRPGKAKNLSLNKIKQLKG